jgi:hypothetical protein
MQNVTRTMTEYEVAAYSAYESDGKVGLNVVAECTVHSTTMNKAGARAALMEAMGTAVPRGCTVVWKPVKRMKYAMPLDKFLDESIVIEEKEI